MCNFDKSFTLLRLMNLVEDLAVGVKVSDEIEGCYEEEIRRMTEYNRDASSAEVKVRNVY